MTVHLSPSGASHHFGMSGALGAANSAPPAEIVLLLVNGTDHLLLADGTDALLLEGPF